MSDPNMKKQTTFENGDTQTGKEDAVPSSELPPLTGDVFVINKFCDLNLVAPVLSALEKRGISYFIDKFPIDIDRGNLEIITQVISSCKLMLLFWTQDVKDASSIIRRVEIAKKCKKPFVIYKVGDFACDKHRYLYDQIAEYSRYEVPQQTPDTIDELASWIYQLLYPDSLSPKPAESVSGDVFVSYRSHNIDRVEPILKELSKRGISYYIDKEQLKSGDYTKKIAAAINACKLLFLYWTEDVDESKYIPNEIHLAFDWGKEIIPYKIGNFDISKQFNVIFDLNRKHIIEDSQATIIDVVDSIQQALTELSSKQTPKQTSKPNFEPPAASPVDSLQKPKETSESSNITDYIQKKIKQLESEAIEAIENEDYKKAIKKLSGLLNLEPNAKDAERLLSFCKLALENENNQE